MGNDPIETPDEPDGATVICWAWSGEEPFGFISVVDDGKAFLLAVFSLMVFDAAAIFQGIHLEPGAVTG